MATQDVAQLLIVDDHPLFRDALAAVVSELESPCEAHFANSAASAIELAKDVKPTLILLDLNLGDSSGLDTLLKLQSGAPDSKIAIVSAAESKEVIQRATALGAVGYVPKSAALDDLKTAIQTLLSGESWLPDNIDMSEEPDGDDTASRLASLTPAQKRVLSGLREGLLNKQIAYEMGISEATVKAHMTAIFRKLGVNSRTQALLTLQNLSDG